ncbi:unnamed protein product [Spirodela intermedia]|uniref:Uncharacterized protein n=1 Tax=Spirodela intermedia TaxID=51605 RepID=A0A7I8ISY5_SPIIN|nr:unnamed protein product [Spirodela intermedia]CAA6660993.1 unnamed protein product [Spirodela intermedia]
MLLPFDSLGKKKNTVEVSFSSLSFPSKSMTSMDFSLSLSLSSLVGIEKY